MNSNPFDPRYGHLAPAWQNNENAQAYPQPYAPIDTSWQPDNNLQMAAYPQPGASPLALQTPAAAFSNYAPVPYAGPSQPPDYPNNAVNPLQAPLAAGILGGNDVTSLTNGAAALAADIAGAVFATNFAGKASGVNLAGGGFAIGGSFVPTAECHLELLGQDPASGMWFVRSHQAFGAAANMAVGGGIAVVGGGAMVGAAWEDAWTYVALAPEDIARALIPGTEKGTVASILANATGSRLVRWPDFSNIDKLGIGEAVRTQHMRSGTVGIVVSSMLQNGVGYMTISGRFDRVVWRPNARFLEISEAATSVHECGIAAGLSVLEKIDLRRENTQAARVTLRFDLQHPSGRALAEAIVQGRENFPLSPAPRKDGSWQERFFHHLPPGVQATKLEVVQQHRQHAGGGILDSLAKYLKASGLGLSFDAMQDKRQEIDAVGVLTSETRANLKQTGVLWLGTSSRLVFVNAQYGQLHGQSEPIFLGLILGMQYEVTKVRGTNRNGFLEDFNNAFGLDIPQFEKIASHAGYYVSVRCKLGAADLERIATLDAAALAQAGIHESKRVDKLLKLRDMLRDAQVQSTHGPQPTHALGGFAPLLLCDAADDPSATPQAATMAQVTDAPSDQDPQALAIARSRVMQSEIASVKTLGALCRLLNPTDETLQVCVRNGACEKPLEAMRTFNLEFCGAQQRVRGDDAIEQVRRRFQKADKLRRQLDRGLEALDKDVLGNALAADDNQAVGRKLMEAYIAVDSAIALDHLHPRQQLALVRQKDIFKLLPPVAQADALSLCETYGANTLDTDARMAAHRALDAEQTRLASVRVPPHLQRLRDAQLELVDEARAKLHNTQAHPHNRTWGPPCSIDLPPHRLAAVQAAHAQGDPLCKLPAYELHFIVQDNAAMQQQGDEVREAIAAFMQVAQSYQADPQSVARVSFIGETLAHQPPRIIATPADAYQLAWSNSGTNALVGNALEATLGDYMAQVRQNPGSKYKAYVVLSTGVIRDPDVAVHALQRAQEAIIDFEDEVCVGFLQLKHARRDGTGIVAGLDVHPKVGRLIDSDTQVDKPVADRVMPLLAGMLNRDQDDANNNRNKAQAIKDTLHRLTHWNWKGKAE